MDGAKGGDDGEGFPLAHGHSEAQGPDFAGLAGERNDDNGGQQEILRTVGDDDAGALLAHLAGADGFEIDPMHGAAAHLAFLSAAPGRGEGRGGPFLKPGGFCGVLIEEGGILAAGGDEGAALDFLLQGFADEGGEGLLGAEERANLAEEGLVQAESMGGHTQRISKMILGKTGREPLAQLDGALHQGKQGVVSGGRILYGD